MKSKLKLDQQNDGKKRHFKANTGLKEIDKPKSK